MIIDSAFYDIDLRLLSSALGKTGRRISLSQLFWFDIDCSGDLSRLDKTALLFFNSGLIGPRLRSDFWLNLCLRFGRTNLCGGGKIFTQKLIQTLFATSSWIFVGIFWIASLNLSHLRMENWTRNSQLFWLWIATIVWIAMKCRLLQALNLCRNLLSCISQPLILGWKTEYRGTTQLFWFNQRIQCAWIWIARLHVIRQS